MSRVATCPQCAAQLAVPDLATSGSRASCPYCNTEFALAGAIRELRSLSLVEPQSESDPEVKIPFSSEATLPDAGGDMPTLSTLFERFRDVPRVDEAKIEKHYAAERSAAEEFVDGPSSELADTVVSGSSDRKRDPFDFDTGELGIERPANIEYQPDALEKSDPVIAAHDPKPEEVAFVAEVVSVAKSHQQRSRGSGSMVRQMVGVVGGGALGLTLGYFALLWWRGPDGDLLGIADRIPSALLPASFDRFDAENDRTALASTGTDVSEVEPKNEVEQATFVTPTSPAEERVGPAEPASFEPPPAQSLAAATVKDAPSYTRGQLNDALSSAEAARDGLLTGSLSDAAAKRTKGESYVKLCQIAESLTFLQNDTLEDPSQQATEFFRDILRTAPAREEIGQIAIRWIDFPKRPHGGVFFAGNILSAKQVGSAYELQIEMEGGGETFTVLTPEKPATQIGMVGVVGSVIEKPAERVSGYAGMADRAVWSRLVFPLN